MEFKTIDFNDGGIFDRFEKESELQRLGDAIDVVHDERVQFGKQLELDQAAFDKKQADLCRKLPQNEIESKQQIEELNNLASEINTRSEIVSAKLAEFNERVVLILKRMKELKGM